MDKTVNQKAWLLVLPVFLVVAFSAVLPLMTMVAGAALGVEPLGARKAAGVLVAMSQDLHTVLWTIAAYTLIQQIEGHLVAPLISREMVYIPPLVLILGIVAITTLFGRYAAIFAAPIAVIIFVAVKKLYIRDSLGDPTPIPGETPPAARRRARPLGPAAGCGPPATPSRPARRSPREGGNPRGYAPAVQPPASRA